jgi:hypothetical protein
MGFCGLNCAACSNYKATVEHDFEELEREAKKWSDDKHSYSVTDMICLGCSRENVSFMFPYCKDCAVRKCASTKEIQNCAECEGFEDCEKIGKFLATLSRDRIGKMMKLMHEKAMASRREAAATKA